MDKNIYKTTPKLQKSELQYIKKPIQIKKKTVANIFLSEESVTKLLYQKNSFYRKSHKSRNASTNANGSSQKLFYISVNSTMNNPNISSKN